MGFAHGNAGKNSTKDNNFLLPKKSNDALKAENCGLKTKLEGAGEVPVISFGTEKELYPGEIREMVLDALETVLCTGTKPNTRREDVLNDLIKKNDCRRVVAEKQDEIRNLLKSYEGMTKTLRQELVNFGFGITDEGRHYKLVFFGDSRYATALSRSPSDRREGKNAASEIIGEML